MDKTPKEGLRSVRCRQAVGQWVMGGAVHCSMIDERTSQINYHAHVVAYVTFYKAVVRLALTPAAEDEDCKHQWGSRDSPSAPRRIYWERVSLVARVDRWRYTLAIAGHWVKKKEPCLTGARRGRIQTRKHISMLIRGSPGSYRLHKAQKRYLFRDGEETVGECSI